MRIPLWTAFLILGASACGGTSATSEEPSPATPASPAAEVARVAPVLPMSIEQPAGPFTLTVGVWGHGGSPVMVADEESALTFSFVAYGEVPSSARRALFAGSTIEHRPPEGPAESLEGAAILARYPSEDLERNAALLLPLEEVFDMARVGDHTMRWTTPEGTATWTVRVFEELDYLTYRLTHDVAHNGWELYTYGLDDVPAFSGLAARMIAHGDAAAARLVPLLDNDEPCFIEGSQEATTGSMFGHRRMDYAAMLLAELRGMSVPELRAQDRSERDRGVAQVRRAVGGPR